MIKTIIELNITLVADDDYDTYGDEYLSCEDALNALNYALGEVYPTWGCLENAAWEHQVIEANANVGVWEDLLVCRLVGEFLPEVIENIICCVESICRDIKKEAVMVRVTRGNFSGGFLIGKYRFKQRYGFGTFEPLLFRSYDWAVAFNNTAKTQKQNSFTLFGCLNKFALEIY